MMIIARCYDVVGSLHMVVTVYDLKLDSALEEPVKTRTSNTTLGGKKEALDWVLMEELGRTLQDWAYDTRTEDS